MPKPPEDYGSSLDTSFYRRQEHGEEKKERNISKRFRNPSLFESQSSTT